MVQNLVNMINNGDKFVTNQEALLMLDVRVIKEYIEALEEEKEELEVYEEKIDCTDFKIVANDMKLRERKIEQPPTGEIYTIIVKAR